MTRLNDGPPLADRVGTDTARTPVRLTTSRLVAGNGLTYWRARRLAPSCCAGRFLCSGRQPDPHRTIPAVKNILPPADIVAIPADRLQKSGLKRLSRMPPKLP